MARTRSQLKISNQIRNENQNLNQITNATCLLQNDQNSNINNNSNNNNNTVLMGDDNIEILNVQPVPTKVLTNSYIKKMITNTIDFLRKDIREVICVIIILLILIVVYLNENKQDNKLNSKAIKSSLLRDEYFNELETNNKILGEDFRSVDEISMYQVLRAFKNIEKEMKQFKTPDDINHIVHKTVQETVKAKEFERNTEKAVLNQKLTTLIKRLDDLELEILKINRILSVHTLVASSNETNSNSNLVNDMKFNFDNLYSELKSIEASCCKRNVSEIHDFKHRKMIEDLKHWIEKTYATRSEIQLFYDNISKKDSSFNIWKFLTFDNNNGLNKTQSKGDLDQVKSIMKQALYIYNADKTGMADFALESSGAYVLLNRCSKSYEISTRLKLYGLFSIPWIQHENSPRLAIQPSMQPGQCWAFHGSQGRLVVKLYSRVLPTSFSIEHIPSVLSPNGQIDSAIKDFQVIGYDNEHAQKGVLLGRYRYEINTAEYLQFFPVQIYNNDGFEVIEFRIESNHGNKEHTCVYRVRVHGVLKANKN